MESTWEYLVLAVSTQGQFNLQMQLNQLGSVGWELVGFAAVDKTIGLNQLQAIVKRRRLDVDGPADPTPGWYADPLGRHELRWWDGLRWQAAVNDNGENGNDWPIPSP